MAGTFPQTPAPSQLSIRSLWPTRISLSQNQKRFARSLGVQRWLALYRYEVLERDDYAPIKAFIMKQRGPWSNFTLILPGFSTPRGSFPGSPLVNGAHAAGVTSVAIDGLTPSQTNIARADDYIKFNGHSKVYSIVEDTNSNGAGQATLSVQPPLVSSVADNEGITTTSVPFTMALAGEMIELPVRPPLLATYEINMIEDV